jgi:threonyl-tRNA synthetase
MNYPDHRRIGRELAIYTTNESVGAGLPLWLPAGAAVRAELERFVVDLERRHGYQHVYTPELAKRELYERSGHWAHYRDEMYPPMQIGGDEVVLRPMNCPHHILVFEAEPRSMREMPYRLAELGTMFRYERSGVLGGLARVRQSTLTIQVDFHLPAQFDLLFQRGSVKERPVMVHRSIVSSMERMVAHLLEVHNGSLPLWLAPTQVTVLPVAADGLEGAARLRDRLVQAGIRADLDDRDASLSARIRDAQQRHVPYMAVVGRREADSDTVSVRLRGPDRQQFDDISSDAFIRWVADIVASRSNRGGEAPPSARLAVV